MVDFNFYKSLYEREQDLRTAHNNKLSFTITITAAIITADAFLCNEVAPWNQAPSWLFIFACLTLSVLLLLQIIFICFSFASLKFNYRDFPVDLLEDDIQEHIHKYKDEHHWATDGDLDKEKQKYIPGMLERTYKLCASVYYTENIKRRKYNFWLTIVSIVNVCSIICFYALSFITKFIKEVQI